LNAPRILLDYIYSTFTITLQYTINVLLNAQDVPLNTEYLNFTINATSVGNEVNADDNYKKLLLPIRIQADMTITG
jgi:hypothetical protein